MPTQIKLQAYVRLTGGFAVRSTGVTELKIRDKLEDEEITDDKLHILSDSRQVEIQFHDFFDANAQRWKFIEQGSLSRGDDSYARVVFTNYTDGDEGQPLDLVVRPEGASTADKDEPTTILIKIEPIEDGPDE